MQKLVIQYSVGDECTFSCEENRPFLYESLEKAEYDLLCTWEEHNALHATAYTATKGYVSSNFEFAGMTFDLSDFSTDGKTYNSPPEIYTLEDWFCDNAPVDQKI